jgi:hypothetical protein
MTDDFAPVETMRAIEKKNKEVEGTDGSAPLMQQSHLRGTLLLSLSPDPRLRADGFRDAGSRYLYPYFGGGINTWASLIATVLVARCSAICSAARWSTGP